MPKRKVGWAGWTFGKRHKTQTAIHLDGKSQSYLQKDRISQLTDDILVNILSQLGVKEAARTCVLSKRWTYLWKRVTCLNFNLLPKPRRRRRRQRVEETATSSSNSWVNHVLELHQGPTLDQIKIFSSSPDYSASEVDDCIEFAMRKRVQKLEIDLQAGRRYCHVHNWYIFPERTFKSPFGFSGLKYLKYLSLKYVNTTDELVEQFLSNCQLLEHLLLFGSKQLAKPKFAHPELRLKSLEICDCLNLLIIEIFAPNLVSLFYKGRRNSVYSIRLRHAPSLVNLSLAETCAYDQAAFASVRNCFHQLVTLNLHMNVCNWETPTLLEFPELTSLKELSLSVVGDDQASLLGLTDLIERSPSLQEFTFKLRWIPDFWRDVPRNMTKVNKCPHRCLKVVKFSGFVGSVIDTELAMYFVENAVALKKFIIDLEKVMVEDSAPLSQFLTAQKNLRATKKRALQIGNSLPPAAELVVM